jgi:hypothetical protein
MSSSAAIVQVALFSLLPLFAHAPCPFSILTRKQSNKGTGKQKASEATTIPSHSKRLLLRFGVMINERKADRKRKEKEREDRS